MMRSRIAYGLSIAGVLMLAGPVLAQEAGHGQHKEGDKAGKHDDMQMPGKSGDKDAKEKEAKLPLCPVMGEPIDFNVKTMTDKGPVYFCCPMCIKKFEANPEKYAEKTAKQRQQLEKRERIQVTCPITGEPVDPKVFIEKDGQKVYFCCPGCEPKYEADPAKYAGKLAASYTYQTKCPVMGDTIDPTVFVDLPTGERIYLCCPACKPKLLAHPEKYAKNLEKQGVNLDLKKLKQELQKEHSGQHDEHADAHAGHGHS